MPNEDQTILDELREVGKRSLLLGFAFMIEEAVEGIKAIAERGDAEIVLQPCEIKQLNAVKQLPPEAIDDPPMKEITNE